jgi:hypothetical protein
MADAWSRFENLLDDAHSTGAEVDVEVTGASLCCWSCKLRYTPNPNVREMADLSLVLYSAGHESAEEGLADCLDQLDTSPSQAALAGIEAAHRGAPKWQRP